MKVKTNRARRIMTKQGVLKKSEFLYAHVKCIFQDYGLLSE